MISKKLEEALNAQINAEMWSAYLYLSMSAYCHRMGYAGMANWFMVQFKEEQDHAMIFFNYLLTRQKPTGLTRWLYLKTLSLMSRRLLRSSTT